MLPLKLILAYKTIYKFNKGHVEKILVSSYKTEKQNAKLQRVWKKKSEVISSYEMKYKTFMFRNTFTFDTNNILNLTFLSQDSIIHLALELLVLLQLQLNWLKLPGTARNYRKLAITSGNGRKLPVSAGNYQKLPETAGN